MKLTVPDVAPTTTKKAEKKQKPAKAKTSKQKPQKAGKTKTKQEPVAKPKDTEPRKRLVTARVNKKPNLVDLHLMKPHNFLSRTEAALTRIYPLTAVGNHRYEVSEQEAAVSVILKLVLKTDQTNPMMMDWSIPLWNITQKNLLPPGVLVTFTRHFERMDNKLAEKAIKRRTNLAVISSGNAKTRNDRMCSYVTMPVCCRQLNPAIRWYPLEQKQF